MDSLLKMQIEHECARLIKVYCNSMDAHDVDRLVGLFAKDAVWQRPGNPPMKGHAEFRNFVENHGQGTTSVHYVTNIVVDVLDEHHASSNAYALSFRESESAGATPLPMSMPRNVVHYKHDFIRDGAQWYIARKEIRFIFQREQGHH
jgi:ketosteroid isomerase-like protein